MMAEVITKCGFQSRFLVTAKALVVLLSLAGISTTYSDTDIEALIAQLTPTRWQQPGTWNFRVLDEQGQPLGHLVLRLTEENVPETACEQAEWKQAFILDGEINYDFGFELKPAYRVHGQSLTVDLTASMCNVDHLFVGEVDELGASGYFNYFHRLGGNIIGTFTAVPVSQ